MLPSILKLFTPSGAQLREIAVSERLQAEATRQELARLEAGRAAEVQVALDHVRAEQLRLQEEREAERRATLVDWEARQAEVRGGGRGG